MKISTVYRGAHRSLQCSVELQNSAMELYYNFIDACSALLFLQMILHQTLQKTQTLHIIHLRCIAVFPRARVCVFSYDGS